MYLAVKEVMYLDAKVNTSGGRKAAMTARTKHGRAKSRKCGDLLWIYRFPLKLNRAVRKARVFLDDQ